MSKSKIDFKDWNSEKIKNLLHENKTYKAGMKLFAIYLMSEGWSARKLEELFDISFKQITNWVHEFIEEGEASLKYKTRTGRNSKLSDEQKNILKKIILNENPKDYKIKGERWNGMLIIELVKKEFGVIYKKAQIYNILKSIKIKSEKSKWIEF